MRSLVALVLVGACGGTTPTMTAADLGSAPDLACPPVGGGLHALIVHIKLVDDGMGVALNTQNGSKVHVPVADILGKSWVFATTEGGKQVANAKILEFGAGTMTQAGSSLTAEIKTMPMYGDGPWELAWFLSIAGKDPAMGPQPGDIAGFSIDPVSPCEPPVTGVSYRMSVHGSDAERSYDNTSAAPYFIRF